MSSAPSLQHQWLFDQIRRGERGPEVAAKLLQHFGRPDLHFRSIRVVGTNGKGSTSTMLAAGLRAAGLSVGRFTSPHLVHFEERIDLNGRLISEERVRRHVDEAPRDTGAGFFDHALALAALHFAEEGADVAVMEAGVGGLSDATHALKNVDAVLLSSVALDHTAALGDTIEAIARDKAGAALDGVPFFTTASAESFAAVERTVRERGGLLYSPHSHPELFELPAPPRMAGAHQRQNAALALAAMRTLFPECCNEAATSALLNATHAGRMERIGEVLLDGAHNPAAAEALAAALAEMPEATRPKVLLFSSFSRKDSLATLRPLLPFFAPENRVFVALSEDSTPPELLGRSGGVAFTDPLEGLAHARQLGGKICVTGSLYLVGLVRAQLLS